MTSQEVEELISRLGNQNSKIRLKATEDLHQSRSDVSLVIESLIHKLASYDENHQKIANEVLIEIGPIVIEALIENLVQQEYSPNRLVVMRTNHFMHSIVKVLTKFDVLAVDPIIQALPNSNSYVRGFLVRSLDDIGPTASSAVSQLIQILSDDPDESVRCASVEALASISPTDQKTIEAIITALNDKLERLRLTAVLALYKVGVLTDDDLTDETLLLSLTYPINLEEINIVNIIGRISNNEVIPMLDAMSRNTSDRLFKDNIQEAIERIKQRD